MMNKKEILEELENLKLLLKFHPNRVINNPVDYENHINDILDRILELEKKLKELE